MGMFMPTRQRATQVTLMPQELGYGGRTPAR